MATERKTSVLAAVLTGVILGSFIPAVAHAATPQSVGDTRPPRNIVTISQAFAPDIISPDTPADYIIKNLNSGKVLQASGGSKANGAYIVQETDTGGVDDSQGWDPGILEHDGLYEFLNAKSQLWLGIDGASKSVGAHAIQAHGDIATNQEWEELPVTGGVLLINDKSNLCLGIDGASKSNGAYAEQFTCDGKANQIWIIE